MASVERGYVGEGIGSAQSASDLTLQAGYDASVGVHRCGHTRVGGKQKPAIVLDGAHARLIQMLGIGAAIAIPTVVRNIHEDLGPIAGELPNFVGKDRFVTDKHA